jgi:tetratricopeptide (TPR) repeat protein
MLQATLSISRVALWALAGVLVLQACAQTASTPPSPPPPPTPPSPPSIVGPEAAAKADWRGPVLDQAMRVASSPEGKSHAKIKSRLQRDVAVCALQLGMTDRALTIAAAIQDWREGEVLALAAQQMARSGERDRAKRCIARAAEIANRTDGWRKETTQAEVGLALALLGDVEAARQFGGALPPELTGRVEAQLSGQVSLEELDRQCDAYDRAIATGSFDVVRSGIDGYFAVWERAPDDIARRTRAERAIRAAVTGLPLDLQIAARIRLADKLLAARDRSAAIAELESAERILAQFEFTTETRGAIVRDLASAWVRMDQPTRARPLVVAAVQAYIDAPTAMVDIDRADYLRPLAEALAALGDADEARAVWTRALEACAVNPNARPRAEDLCLTCLSMVRADVPPSDAMRQTMQSIEAGLKAPW